MSTALLRKLGWKDGMRTVLVRAPAAVAAALEVPGQPHAKRLAGRFDWIVCFAVRRSPLQAAFPRLKVHLGEGGMLWIAWPKGGGSGTDLALATVIALGYDAGLVESKTVSIDASWSAIKFTWPKPGKRYQNRYGTLPPAPSAR